MHPQPYPEYGVLLLYVLRTSILIPTKPLSSTSTDGHRYRYMQLLISQAYPQAKNDLEAISVLVLTTPALGTLSSVLVNFHDGNSIELDPSFIRSTMMYVCTFTASRA